MSEVRYAKGPIVDDREVSKTFHDEFHQASPIPISNVQVHADIGKPSTKNVAGKPGTFSVTTNESSSLERFVSGNANAEKLKSSSERSHFVGPQVTTEASHFQSPGQVKQDFSYTMNQQIQMDKSDLSTEKIVGNESFTSENQQSISIPHSKESTPFSKENTPVELINKLNVESRIIVDLKGAEELLNEARRKASIHSAPNDPVEQQPGSGRANSLLKLGDQVAVEKELKEFHFSANEKPNSGQPLEHFDSGIMSEFGEQMAEQFRYEETTSPGVKVLPANEMQPKKADSDMERMELLHEQLADGLAEAALVDAAIKAETWMHTQEEPLHNKIKEIIQESVHEHVLPRAAAAQDAMFNGTMKESSLVKEEIVDTSEESKMKRPKHEENVKEQLNSVWYSDEKMAKAEQKAGNVGSIHLGSHESLSGSFSSQASEFKEVLWSETREEAKQSPSELARSCSDTNQSAWASKDHESVNAQLGQIPANQQHLTQKGVCSEDSVDFINVNQGFSETVSQIKRPSETSLNLTVDKEPNVGKTDLNIRLQSLESGPVKLQPLSVANKKSIESAEVAEDIAEELRAASKGPFEQTLVIQDGKRQSETVSFVNVSEDYSQKIPEIISSAEATLKSKIGKQQSDDVTADASMRMQSSATGPASLQPLSKEKTGTLENAADAAGGILKDLQAPYEQSLTMKEEEQRKLQSAQGSKPSVLQLAQQGLLDDAEAKKLNADITQQNIQLSQASKIEPDFNLKTNIAKEAFESGTDSECASSILQKSKAESESAIVKDTYPETSRLVLESVECDPSGVNQSTLEFGEQSSEDLILEKPVKPEAGIIKSVPDFTKENGT